MKKSKLKEARTKDILELKKDLNQVQEQLAKTRLELLSGKIKNVRAVKNLRRDIAQLNTLIKKHD